MVNSLVKAIFPISISIFLCPQISLEFLFPDTTESETGEEILIYKLDDDKACIQLKYCPTLSWLKRKLPTTKYVSQLLIIQDIPTILKSKRCVISELDSEEEVTMETRVVCQKLNETSIDKNNKVYDADCANEDDCEGRLSFELHKGQASIECSIELQHGEFDNPST